VDAAVDVGAAGVELLCVHPLTRMTAAAVAAIPKVMALMDILLLCSLTKFPDEIN
jgi:hypothetical protein